MMKIEVWSDIMCPFCYIGKLHYEQALSRFPDAGAVSLEWKSFQLDPTLSKQPTYTDTYHYLSVRKGIAPAQANEMMANIVQAGEAVGITFRFDQAIIANTFDAHRLLQFAKTRQLDAALHTLLFRAHFSEGKNIGDNETLIALACQAGLDAGDARGVLQSNLYADAVTNDIREARQIGVQGVPFFVFNRKYAISGAQPPNVFLQTLEKSFSEWRRDHPAPKLDIQQGPSCGPDGTCQ